MTRTYSSSLTTGTDNYGIYDCLVSNKEYTIKSIGLLSKTDYMFRTDIADHWGDAEKIGCIMGKGRFRICVQKRNEEIQDLDIFQVGHEFKADSFELSVIKSLLSEAKRFADEGNLVEVSIPPAASKDDEEHNRISVANALLLIS